MASAVVVVLAGMGCGGGDDAGPVCGDDVCEAARGETSQTCSQDCPTAQCIAECTRLEVCSMRIRVPSFFPATYAVTLEQGRFPATGSNGMPWDVDGPPDPYVTVVFGTTTLGAGDPVVDSVEPMWNDTLATTVALDRSDLLRLDVYDEDGATDELMFSCTANVNSVLYDSVDEFHYGCQMEPSQARGWVGFALKPL